MQSTPRTLLWLTMTWLKNLALMFGVIVTRTHINTQDDKPIAKKIKVSLLKVNSHPKNKVFKCGADSYFRTSGQYIGVSITAF